MTWFQPAATQPAELRRVEQLEDVTKLFRSQPVGGQDVDHRVVGHDLVVQLVGFALLPKPGQPLLGRRDLRLGGLDIDFGLGRRRHLVETIAGIECGLHGEAGLVDGAIGLLHLAGQPADIAVNPGDRIAALFELRGGRRRLGHFEPGFGEIDPAQGDKRAAVRARHARIDSPRGQRGARLSGDDKLAGEPFGGRLGLLQCVLAGFDGRCLGREPGSFSARHGGGGDRLVMIPLGECQGGEQVVFLWLFKLELPAGRDPRRADATTPIRPGDLAPGALVFRALFLAQRVRAIPALRLDRFPDHGRCIVVHFFVSKGAGEILARRVGVQ